jgi:hypothetical protein
MCHLDVHRYTNPAMDGNGDGCVDESRFTSIPNTFWFVVVTMTTVGYGDYVPITVAGKLLSMLTALSGILILALPITVITYNFEVECTKQEEAEASGDRRSVTSENSCESQRNSFDGSTRALSVDGSVKGQFQGVTRRHVNVNESSMRSVTSLEDAISLDLERCSRASSDTSNSEIHPQGGHYSSSHRLL